MDAVAVTVRVPATSANLGPGFDSLGLALDVFAEITVTFAGAPLPPGDDVGERIVLAAVRATYAQLGRPVPEGLQARYGVSIPLGRGMGASAVARVAGVLAVNENEGHPLDPEACLVLASELEGHGDNACPALFGGVQVCVQVDGRFVHTGCRYPADAQVALLVPDHTMATKDARRVLPDTYSRADAVFNSGRTALLVAALANGEYGLLDEATQDRIHQRQRATLFPPLFDIFAAAKGAGAHAAWLSGAGSTVAALCSGDAARPAAAAMLATLQAAGMSGRTIVTRIAPKGAEIARVELAPIGV